MRPAAESSSCRFQRPLSSERNRMSEYVCKACGSTAIDLVDKVHRIPVHSCLMVHTRAEALAFPTGDLELGFCNDCGFIQIVKFDPPPQNYSPDYEETQAFSPR